MSISNLDCYVQAINVVIYYLDLDMNTTQSQVSKDDSSLERKHQIFMYLMIGSVAFLILIGLIIFIIKCCKHCKRSQLSKIPEQIMDKSQKNKFSKLADDEDYNDIDQTNN